MPKPTPRPRLPVVRVPLIRCPRCGSADVTKGPRRRSWGENLVQYVRCRTCAGDDGEGFKFRVHHEG